MSASVDSQPEATQPQTYHADDDSDTDADADETAPKAWGRLLPLTPEFATIGLQPECCLEFASF